MSSQFVEQTFSAEGRLLNYARGPAHGPPLVMLHGVTRCLRTFLPLLPALSLRAEVFALDFRGHNRSARAPEQYLVADYVRDALALVRSEVRQPVLIYGHSLGSMVAAGVAAAAPELVRAVVLEDPPIDTMGTRLLKSPLYGLFSGMLPLCGSRLPIREIARALAEIRMSPPGEQGGVRLGDVRDPAALRLSAHFLSRLDPGVLAPIVAGRWLQGFDWKQILSAVRCPALLLQADAAAGGMLIDEEAAQAEALIADCSRVRMPGAAHLIHWNQTEALLRVVVSFLESNSEV